MVAIMKRIRLKPSWLYLSAVKTWYPSGQQVYSNLSFRVFEESWQPWPQEQASQRTYTVGRNQGKPRSHVE